MRGSMAIRWLWDKLRAISFPRWMGIFALAFAAIYEYNQIASDSVLIDAFSVPKPYDESGWNSQTLTARIRDDLDQMEGALQRQRRDHLELSVDQSTTPDFEVPGTGLGLKSLENILRQLLHREARHAGGEILLPLDAGAGITKAQAEISVRSSQGGVRRRRTPVYAPAGNPEAVAQAAAEQVLEEINPYMLAAYLSRVGDNVRAAQVAQVAATDGSKEKRYRAAAYNAWGAALIAQGQYPAAVEKLQKSLELEPKSAATWNNWGSALKGEGKLDEAAEKYRKAAGMGGKSGAMWRNLAATLDTLGRHDEAKQMYDKASQAEAASK